MTWESSILSIFSVACNITLPEKEGSQKRKCRPMGNSNHHRSCRRVHLDSAFFYFGKKGNKVNRLFFVGTIRLKWEMFFVHSAPLTDKSFPAPFMETTININNLVFRVTCRVKWSIDEIRTLSLRGEGNVMSVYVSWTVASVIGLMARRWLLDNTV